VKFWILAGLVGVAACLSSFGGRSADMEIGSAPTEPSTHD
jgi:hypothetical protein